MGISRTRGTYPSVCAVAVVSTVMLVSLHVTRVRGDGTETLGAPSITITPGSGITAGGTGMAGGSGTINITVPTDATVQQVILYWTGFAAQVGPADTGGPTSIDSLRPGTLSRDRLLNAALLRDDDQDNFDIGAKISGPADDDTDSRAAVPLAAAVGDQTITVGGISVVGTLIGGPTLFAENHLGAAYRADITFLGLVGPGESTLLLSGLDFDVKNDGAGVLVIYDDGTSLAEIQVRDGHDLAFNWFEPPLDTTVPQTFNFAPAAQQRIAKLELFVGDTDAGRPNRLLVTIGGVTTTYFSPFEGYDGPEWDTLTLPLIIPPAAGAITVQALSETDASGAVPTSLAWVVAALMVGPDAFDDCNNNLIPDPCDVSCEGLDGACDAVYPTDCGQLPDCNGNAQPDSCDLAGDDCDQNGVPDSCEGGSGECDDGNRCTINDTCTNGVCIGEVLDCSHLSTTCALGVCNPTNGTCRTVPRNTGGACDDGVPCTHDDFCWNGVCVGFETDCSDIDDECGVGVCDPDTGECVPDPINEGGPCDDGDLCTIDDACAAGACAGELVDCSELDDGCNIGACDPDTGLCTPQPANEGGACEDGDLCSDNDLCTNGVCLGTTADCTGLDDVCNAGACDPLTGECISVPQNEGGACDDGDGCTTDDACLDGACVGSPLDCSALDGACTVGVCLGTAGVCTAETANEGGVCDDGDACTVNDLCDAGACLGDTLDCSALDDACNVGVCAGTSGLCESEPANEAGTCDDGNLCTINDACSNGACAGTPVDCSALDSDCTIGVCDAQTGNCIAQSLGDGTVCDDGDDCTVDDSCIAGECAGDERDCSALDDACNIGVCVGTSGVCEAVPAGDGGTCDDGDGCTVLDACSNGTCRGESLDCSGLDDACHVGACVGTSGICEALPANDADGCDDSDLCTIDDTCSNGECAGTPVDCSALDSECTIGVCDALTGNCIAQPLADGVACDDGDGCTDGDACLAGVCSGEPLDCSALDDACNVGACIGTSGVCEAVPANDGGVCDDGNGCSVLDACSNGACGGEPLDCSGFDDACHVGACIGTSGVCLALPANNGGTCDDGDLCTLDDACSNGECAGTPVDCSGLDDACNIGVCDPATGGCITEPQAEGGTCDDGDLCTVDDACSNGACAGEPRDCSALDDACNIGVCDPDSGACVAVPAYDGGTCDDGDDCTVNDTCSAGACAGETKDCSGLDDACNIGECVGTTGVCAAVPANEGGSCDDGDGCTENDACRSGVCTGAALDCSALDDACNVGECVGTTGTCAAVAVGDGGTCDDGDPCTVDDACSGGACAGEPMDCSGLDDACNAGVCDPLSGACIVQPANDGGACNDGNGCTENDVCSNGACGGQPLDCSSLDDICNVGECIGTTGVCAAVPANEGGTCTDGEACTVADACSSGVCIGAPMDCSALDDVCNVGVCVDGTGVCTTVPANEGGACNDGNGCTVNDTCSAGACAGVSMDCGAGMVCDEARAACVRAASFRVKTSQKGSLLIYPKVELRWNAAGELIQDTYIALTNDYPAAVNVQMYFINGDPPTSANTSNGTILERAHPGWNHADVGIILTANQPTYWSTASGLPSAGGVPPFTVLDQAPPLGRPDPEGGSERVLRGYIVAWAVDNLGREIRWNQLGGSALLVNFTKATAWEYPAYAFQTRDGTVPHGGLTGTPGELHMDGVEYDNAYGQLLLDFYATGDVPLGHGASLLPLDTDLTLLPASADLRQESSGPVTTKASFTIWNANEVKFTGLDLCVTCWDQRMLSRYGVPNHFLRANLQTDRGRAQIDGLASQLCNVDYDEGDVCTQTFGGPAPTCDPRDVLSVRAALVGVQAKHLCFGSNGCDISGQALTGMGEESALLQADFIGSPPPERPGGDESTNP